MLASRKALMSNLNYVHLQHVSLGIHLSRRAEVKDVPINQDTGLKDVSGCHHQWKDNSDITLVDANSNDPSVTCQCCDQHPRQEDTLQYGLQDNLEAILPDGCLSPNDLPLSPLSPSSPSTDSSSSSDFTLDDSPISMYYKEYSQDILETPDQQPDIIPLDVATEDPVSSELENSMSLLQRATNTTLILDPSHPNNSENMNNNNTELTDTLFGDWNSDSILDSNCNALLQSQQLDQTSVSSPFMNNDTIAKPRTKTDIVEKQDNTNANFEEVPHLPVDGDLLPGLSFTENGCTQTPKKTITSFHELAQKRRKSGGLFPSQPKKDRSDWLIVFSPDTEQPPVNELTASAFYHGALVPQTHPLSAGKEVTTFKELRYRNTLNKQGVQQGKVHNIGERGCQASTEGPSETPAIGIFPHISWEQNVSQHLVTKKMMHQDSAARETKDQRQGHQPRPNMANGYQKPDTKMQEADFLETPQRIWSLSGHKISTFVDTLSAMKGQNHESTLKNGLCNGNEERPEKEIVSTKAGAWIRGMADGGDKRCREAGEWTPLMANEDSVQREKKCLLIAIGSSVEKIISHFNTSRNQVQKAQLGDSRLSPTLGYLILNHLCPSLYSLLGDGLKPFQKDVIIGRRWLSPWSVVEASIKTGPKSLQTLFCKVNRLQQLRDPQRRFNAFIYGLLNTKQLDVWVSHLHQTYDQLSIFFLPTGFLPTAVARPDLQEELLLTLQPLSALTFHIDLLFEHHHLQLQDLSTPHRRVSQGQTSHNWGVPSFQHILDIGGWITHNLTGNAEKETASPSKGKSEDSLGDACSSSGGPQLDLSFHSRDGPQELSSHGRDILQDLSAHQNDSPQNLSSPVTASMQNVSSHSKDHSNKWWEHLHQASRMYIPSKKDSFSFTTLRKLTSWGTSDIEYDQRATSEEKDSTEGRNVEKTSYECSQDTVNGNEIPNDSIKAIDRGDSCEGLKESFNGAEGIQPIRTLGGNRNPHRSNDERGNWFGQLFGASSSHEREMETRNVKPRRPSSWLPPNVNVWNFLRKPSTSGKLEIFPQESEGTLQKTNQKPERSLRALCDHAASGETQLSFKKGDILQLVGTVDEDWIRCRHGSDAGLVPVAYTSLIL
ncbi:AP-4 complex accessory subunit RUSC1 [Mixophyes fleayi]|uniref:AP-4 complex accessory subunit RUSC1 n=1 Tax=Mixophyes fleayi TaxID=3061075 RepID=UPI003F4E35A2